MGDSGSHDPQQFVITLLAAIRQRRESHPITPLQSLIHLIRESFTFVLIVPANRDEDEPVGVGNRKSELSTLRSDSLGSAYQREDDLPLASRRFLSRKA
jgi:hypothetical protein